MKKIIYLMCALLIVSCGEWRDPWKKDKIKVEGRVVETYYSPEIIFSVRPLSGVKLRIENGIVAETNTEGKYKFSLHKPGVYQLFAEKSGYKTKSMRLDLVGGTYRERDFHLERVDEGTIGWSTFPMTSDGGRVSITANGLTLTSGGRNEVYATKTIRVRNNRFYKFTSSMKKDPSTQMIYFGVHPQISGYDWKYEHTNLNSWRESIISFDINDTTIIDMSYIYDDLGVIIDTVYVYPDSVYVVLEIRVELGTNFPTGFFREIRVEGG